MIYVDTSALVPLFIPQDVSSDAQTFIAREQSVLVSDYGAGEFSSVMSRLVRTGYRTPEIALELCNAFDEWVLRRVLLVEGTNTDVRAATLLVRQFDLMLKLPDAIHLAICRRIGATLLTFDVPMRRAAERLKVPLV